MSESHQGRKSDLGFINIVLVDVFMSTIFFYHSFWCMSLSYNLNKISHFLPTTTCNYQLEVENVKINGKCPINNNLMYRVKRMVRLYPVIFIKKKKDILVEVPDFDVQTAGKDMNDALFMARDIIGLMGSEYIFDQKKLPVLSDIESVKAKAFKKEGPAIKMLVDVDIENYVERENSKTVRKNVSIPKWLDIKAKEMKINVSKLLTEALTKKVAILG